MLDSLIQHLNCEVCRHELIYDPRATFDVYSCELELTVEDVKSEIDNVVGRFLVYECSFCKKTYRYTYKDIEAAIRIDMTKQVLLTIAREQMKNMVYIMDGVLIYCGKCTGFDGNGSCTKKMYDNCEVKRFPSVI